MTAAELRQKFLDFFEEKGHTIILSAPLVPENDPTVLFTTAGMHPLVPYLLGEDHPGGKRVANVQICIRTTDIDEIGDTTHHTFFEMLGNWSFGDSASPDGIGKAGYFKEDAIKWSWEFLTSPKWLGLDKKRIAVSVFAGDADAPFDQEAFAIWKGLGVQEKRIAKLPKENNWWGPAGESGPCGPDTEMFYWVGDPNKAPESFNDDNDLWVEIWNDVFMQFNKTKEGKYESLKQKNVDTGMGLERVLVVMNGLDDNYKTDLFAGIISKIEELFGEKYGESAETTKTIRIIADHIKAATFILAEKIEPSNIDRGYIARRLIRRAIRYGKQLGINNAFTHQIAEVVIDIYEDVYPHLKKNKDFIVEQLVREEEKFSKTLEKGLIILYKELKIVDYKPGIALEPQDMSYVNGMPGFLPGNITGKWLFDFYQTFGFPPEMVFEELRNRGKKFTNLQTEKMMEEFNEEFKKHQKLSRTASAGKFKGGLADHSEIATKYHTATHLLLASLRQVLGDHVFQRGSNITAERLRFDFSHSQKMTPQEIKQTEDLVNQQIEKGLFVKTEEMTPQEAKKSGAIGVFEQKYGERVKVYAIYSPETNEVFSKEICGGPHVEKISILGKFKIIKEEASSAGVRRIKAVLG